ncbi:GH39 family glycosyl hydrolase [Edaphobacter albus]|uniref:GH39 family glycosyl hydrolase n=1 Tax=Edaphobacter sp. 4G125 TaxID=2763071 RepID=UPI00164573B0|nr:glycosyl hydrolase family 39 [Edaphobacter sp. 4G125]QNI36663.1 glycosyl hydrolase family 39 [Edaphobacter sp. 4G125]
MNCLRLSSLKALLLLPLLGTLSLSAQTITIDANAPTTPFPHFWEEMFGSGRAALVLRQSYLNDLKAVKQVTDFRYVRFHAILHDELGVYNEDEHGNPVYNFAYVNQVYDNLLANGVRPVVEIGFMPKKLAFNPDALHPFWYKQNVSPPKSMEKWDGLITAFAKNLVQRYGIDEVSQWYFEVWNEPNIDFWNGIPRQRSYFELYDHTARDLKAVSPRLRVGGPATAAAQWVSAFLKHTAENNVPVDFVSSHGYADDTVENMFPDDPSVPKDLPMDQRVCRAIGMVRNQMKAAGKPKLPLFWTEWNVPGHNQSRDTTYVGAALANTVRQCDGLVDMMSFWTFSDVFEEGGPGPRPFIGQFGLRAEFGINKPSYYGFALLHQLGDRRIANNSPDIIVTKLSDGSLKIAAWNLVDPDPDSLSKAKPRTLTLVLRGTSASARATTQRVDNEHGNVLPEYAKIGKPDYPTPQQVEQLNRATALPTPEETHLQDHQLTVTLEPNALLLITVTP